MASSRRTATNESVSTYGDGTRDYSVLATWEAATDLDMVATTTSYVLECYDDSASFDDFILLDGAAGDTDASYFRIIRPAGTKGEPSWQGHDGTSNNGFNIISTTDANVVQISEDYGQVQDIIFSLQITSANNRSCCFAFGNANGGAGFIGCIVHDCLNDGAGVVNASFELGAPAPTTLFVIDCLAHDNQGNGFRFINGANGRDNRAYNNTAVDNGFYGFVCFGTNAAASTTWINNLATGNTIADFARESVNPTLTVTTCASSDGTADDFGGSGNIVNRTITYKDAPNDDYHTSDSDVAGQGTDLSADGTFAFDDDIDWQLRGAWDMGFDEFIYPPIIMHGDGLTYFVGLL